MDEADGYIYAAILMFGVVTAGILLMIYVVVADNTGRRLVHSTFNSQLQKKEDDLQMELPVLPGLNRSLGRSGGKSGGVSDVDENSTTQTQLDDTLQTEVRDPTN